LKVILIITTDRNSFYWDKHLFGLRKIDTLRLSRHINDRTLI
jgi:hypothetical protein